MYESRCKVCVACDRNPKLQSKLVLYRQLGFSLSEISQRFERFFPEGLNEMNLSVHYKKHCSPELFEPDTLNKVRTFVVACFELETGKTVNLPPEWRNMVEKDKECIKNLPK